MKNVWIICRKELKSYFVSPIAYGLMAFFAAISGYFFYIATAIFVTRGMESQMMGRGMPMDLNEWVIRPLLMNVSVIGLFMIPMITMRLFAEEKRSGTIELLATSPVRDLEIILGKWFAALIMYACRFAPPGEIPRLAAASSDVSTATKARPTTDRTRFTWNHEASATMPTTR